MRYRDNVLVRVTGPQYCPLDLTATELTALLSMPVKGVGRGAQARCLEVHLRLGAAVPCCILAFRTDADRQGESWDVRSWPEVDDPRTPMILPGLLMGLASKLRFYTLEGVGGYTATIRRMYQFVKSKGYPSSWWVRPLALALLRVGAVLYCLPPLMREALGSQPRCRRQAVR